MKNQIAEYVEKNLDQFECTSILDDYDAYEKTGVCLADNLLRMHTENIISLVGNNPNLSLFHIYAMTLAFECARSIVRNCR